MSNRFLLVDGVAVAVLRATDAATRLSHYSQALHEARSLQNPVSIARALFRSMEGVEYRFIGYLGTGEENIVDAHGQPVDTLRRGDLLLNNLHSNTQITPPWPHAIAAECACPKRLLTKNGIKVDSVFVGDVFTVGPLESELPESTAMSYNFTPEHVEALCVLLEIGETVALW